LSAPREENGRTQRDAEGEAKREPTGLLNGKLLIAVTLSLVIIVPLATWSVWTLVHRDLAGGEQPLQWDQRSDWQGIETTPVSFRRGLMSSARTGETFEDFGFHLDANVKEALRECAELARLPKSEFAAKRVREQLKRALREHPDLFYATYLLGTWHRLHEHPKQARQYYNEAFRQAGAALIVPFERGNQPAATQPVGTLAIALDRVQNDVLIQDLKLVFPYLRTDERGSVYLPLYADTPYRFTEPAQAAATKKTRERGWFTFPGRIGRGEARSLGK